MKTKDRYLEIDLLRALAIVMMVTYHAAYDLSAFFHVSLDPLSGGWLMLQRATATLFLLLVGVSFAISYGRMEARGASRREIYGKYARRGILVLLCGMLVTLVTFFAVGDAYVRFGVLHLIGVGIIILPFMMPLKEWNVLTAAIAIALGPWIAGIAAPTQGCGWCVLPFGVTPPAFVSVDYYPLFPWLATILIGTAVGNVLYNREWRWGDDQWRDGPSGRPYDHSPDDDRAGRGWLRWHLPDNRFTRIVTEPGRHALVIYLAHQPILLLTLWLVMG